MAHYNPRLKKHFKSKESSKRAEAGIWAWRKKQKKRTNHRPRSTRETQLEKEVRIKATIVIVIIGVLSYFGANQNLINMIIHFFANSLSGMIINAASKGLVLKFNLKWLQRIRLTFNIGSYEFSITAFAIAVFIVEKWIFQ